MSKGGRISGMQEFKIISGLPDSTCQRLAPFFQFPKYASPKEFPKNPKMRDLNTATAEELQMIRGIGPVLSKRIVRFRKALGGFLIASQVEDVFGLDPETARRAIKAFPLRTVPSLEKIDLNRASVEELAGILYLNRQMARDIVAYRNQIGAYEYMEQLNSVESLPSDRIDRIALYLKL
jgi:DNA uptake protein ComE-like DNA-binding protein